MWPFKKKKEEEEKDPLLDIVLRRLQEAENWLLIYERNHYDDRQIKVSYKPGDFDLLYHYYSTISNYDGFKIFEVVRFSDKHDIKISSYYQKQLLYAVKALIKYHNDKKEKECREYLKQLLSQDNDKCKD